MPAEVKPTLKQSVGSPSVEKPALAAYDGEENASPDERHKFNGDSMNDSFYHLDQRFFRTAVNLVGYVFRVKTSEGKIFEGILETFDPDVHIALSLAHEVIDEDEDCLPHASMITEKMIFSRENIVMLTTVTESDLFVTHKSTFATDSEISKVNGAAELRDLEVWEPDSHPEENDDNFMARGERSGTGWDVEDMLAKNKTLGVISTYNEDLTQFSNVQIDGDQSSTEFQERLAQAERMAQAIQANPASLMAAGLENDDEERDIAPPSPSPVSPRTSAVAAATTVSGGTQQQPPLAPVQQRQMSQYSGDQSSTASTDTRPFVPPHKRRSNQNQKSFSKPSGPFSRAGPADGGSFKPGPPLARPSRMGPSTDDFGANAAASGGGNYQQASSGAYNRMRYNNPPPSSGGQPHPSAAAPYHQAQSPSYNAPQQSTGGGGGGYGQDRSPSSGQPIYNEWERRNQQQSHGKRDGMGMLSGNQSSGRQPYSQQYKSSASQGVKQNYGARNQRDRGDQLAELKKFGNAFQLVAPTQQPPPTDGQQPPSPYASAAATAQPMQRLSSPPMQPTGPSSAVPPANSYTHARSSPPHGTAGFAPRMNAPEQHPAPPAGAYYAPRAAAQQHQSSPPRHQGPAAAQAASNKPLTPSAPPPQQQRPAPAAAAGANYRVHSVPPPQPPPPLHRQDDKPSSTSPLSEEQPPTVAEQRRDEEAEAQSATPTPSETVSPTPPPEETIISKSKLNPDAKEFCPSQFYSRPTPAQTPAAAGAYPAAVQSPSALNAAPLLTTQPPPMQPVTAPVHLPTLPHQSASPQATSLGGNGAGALMPAGAALYYAAAAGPASGLYQQQHLPPALQAAVQQQPPPPQQQQSTASGPQQPPPVSAMTSFPAMTLLPGAPVYTINQPTVAILHSNNPGAPGSTAYRQIKVNGGQNAGVAAATGPPLVTAPFPAGGSYILYPNAGATPSAVQPGAGGGSMAQQHPTAAYQQYVIGAPRMQQYLVQSTIPNNADNAQQPIYMAQGQTNAAGQSLMTAPYGSAASPYVLHYAVPNPAAAAAAGQTHPTAVAYQPAPYIFNPSRMQYAMPPGAQPVDNNQQPVYITSFSQPVGAYPHVMRNTSVTGFMSQQHPGGVNQVSNGSSANLNG